ncbi:MAG TPA: hypothetical protein VFC19_49275 [Candidatus Limnocylindrales bacterium]|nr:hypothetical protein [Candidatus Limnocylindrales bacterium]
MALGDPYATRDEIKTYVKIPLADTQDDTLIDDALASVSTEIEDVCERQFNKQTSATARRFIPSSSRLAWVDDFLTTSGLAVAVDFDGDGVYETTLSGSDYELYPVDGIMYGQPGWPFYQIRLRPRFGRCFPCGYYSLQTTAQWGWNAIPKPVKESCKIATAETLALKDVRFGVAGYSAVGEALRVRDNPMVMKKLKRYISDLPKVA